MYTSYYQPQQTPRPLKTKRHRVSPLLFVLLIVGALVLSVWRFDEHTSAVARHDTLVAQAQAAAEAKQRLAAMDSKIHDVLAANPGVDISISIANIHSGTSYGYGPAVPYEAASVAKLITATDYLHEVQTGAQSLGATLEDGNTARQDLEAMIVNSDNNAWQSVTDQLGLQDVGAYANRQGISDYDLDTNTLETGDIAQLLVKLYTGKLLNASNTKLLLGYMHRANYTDFILPAVPSGVAVYHKAGVLDDRIHDAAIIDNGKNPFVLVIFTNGHGTGDDTARAAAIQSITAAALAGFGVQ